MAFEELLELPGVGPSTAKALAEAGFGDRAALEGASIADLLRVPGFGEVRARGLVEAVAAGPAPVVNEAQPDQAREVIDGPPQPPAPAESPSTSKQQVDKARKRRAKIRRKLGAELKELKAQRAEVELRVKKLRRRLGKVDSKKRRKKLSAELARFRKQSKKLKRRIDTLKADRRRAGD